MRHFCTLFDENYATSGIALYRSLREHTSDFRLHVLCLDATTKRIVETLGCQDLEAISLEELEAADSDLKRARDDRSLLEYYYTCKSAFALHLLETREIDGISFMGADLYFYAPPRLLYERIGEASVAVHSHRFPPENREKEWVGRYNADFVFFADDDQGRDCLRRWRERCLEWCYEHLEGDRYADQRYLDDWPERYDDVAVLDHPGVGLAEWNRSTHSLSVHDDDVFVDGEPLIFYHFSGLERISASLWSPPFDAMTQIERDHIYLPYIRARLDASDRIESETGDQVMSGSLRNDTFYDTARKWREITPLALARYGVQTLRLIRRALRGDLIQVDPHKRR